MKIAVKNREDGFGAQFQNFLFAWAYCQLMGHEYVHNAIQSLQHNYNNRPNWIKNAEKLMNLEKYYVGDLSECEFVGTEIYEYVEGRIDQIDWSRVKEIYWDNKERDFYKNGKFNIAVHIRRPNSRDVRVEGCDTPNDYYLYIIKKLREENKHKDIQFHIYSQGKISQFEVYKNEDTILHIDGGTFKTFEGMVAADVLVTSASSFSYTAALLSDGVIIYHPFWHRGLKHWNVMFDFHKLKAEKKKIPVLMSTMKFALTCDYIICNRFGNCHEKIDRIIYDKNEINKLKNGQKLFINGTKIETFVDDVVLILKGNNVVLSKIIISNIEPFCDEESVMKLLDCADNIYVCNNIIDHPKIHPLPIGLRDTFEHFSEHINYNHNFIRHAISENFEKDFLCLLCFRLDESSSQNRKDCYDILGGKEWIFNLNTKSFEEENNIKQCGVVPYAKHLEYIGKSKYGLCPTGYGVETHKFYECLLLKCIPIVTLTNTPQDRIYDVYPCLKLNSWDELTSELLNERYDELSQQLEDFETNLILNNLCQ